MPDLVASFEDAQFWHGNSLFESASDDRTLVVSDPPRELAQFFDKALRGAGNFAIFAGLSGSAKTVSDKLTSLDRFSLGNMVMHCTRTRDDFRPQFLITSSKLASSFEYPSGEIYDSECDDCLAPDFIKWCVDMHFNPAVYDTIYDPFCGDGSTALAALSLGKKFVGMDIDRERVVIAAEKYSNQLTGVGSVK